MLYPVKFKHKKVFKGNIKGNTSKGHKIIFGSYALKSLEITRLTSRQIEAARKIITRKMKRQGRLWIRIFPAIPVTKKSSESRMGKGKGSFHSWISKIKPGQILFEITGIPKDVAIKSLQSASKKLQVNTKIVLT